MLDRSSGGVVVAESILAWGEHAERRVAPLLVVEDLEVFEHGVGPLDPGAPPPAVQQLGLHASPNDSMTASS